MQPIQVQLNLRSFKAMFVNIVQVLLCNKEICPQYKEDWPDKIPIAHKRKQEQVYEECKEIY